MFCKADKHDEYTDPPVVLKSNALTFLEGTDIQESLKIVLNELNMKIDEFVRNGSGWVLHHLERIDFGILRYNPLKASSLLNCPRKSHVKKLV